MGKDLFEIVVLGVLQGLTEFLPVSSSGHLAVAGMLFGLQEAGLALNVLLHGGTLLATVLVLRGRVMSMAGEAVAALRTPGRLTRTDGGRDLLTVTLATLPTVVVALALRNTVDQWTHSMVAVAFGFAVTGALLLATRWVRSGEQAWPSWRMALLIGLAQGLAVVPGVSRSGTTIALALALGIRPRRAFELSMLMSLPAVLGAVLLEAPKAFQQSTDWGVLVAGFLVSFAVGVVALLLLRRVVVSGRFSWFAMWVLPLAVVTPWLGP